MKKIIIFFFFICAMSATGTAQDTVKVGAFNFYPGIFKDTDGAIKGFYVDALTEIGQSENITIAYVYGTWDEGLERIKHGEVDLLTSVAITEDRLKYMDYSSIPLLTVWSEVYVNETSEINGVLDLEGKTIAVMKSDFNGAYLKELTEKLSVDCSFVETADFEGVFKLISGNKVDAGVVNNTFGVPKSGDYGLLSSGIVFNPFDIFFTVKKGSNEELLQLIDKYLNRWINDRNSVFNASRQKWSHDEIGSIQVFPKWLDKGIYSALAVVFVLILFIVLLRYRVRAAIKKEKYSKKLFETFMENTPARVYIKDNKLNHIYRNRMVNRVNSVGPGNKNSSAKTVFEPEVAKLVEKEDARILSSEIKQTNIKYRCKLNGKSIWLDDYKFHLELPNGEPAVAGISFDITQLKDAEFELTQAKEKAEESDRLKSAFLANMSHEIRTPMNGILGFAELLKEPGLKDEMQKSFLEVIEKSGSRMLSIINAIIDISKIESGLMKLNIKQSNINDQIDYIYTFFKPEAETKGISLSINKPLEAKNAIIETDSEKLYAIFTNLVKNAIKYTSKGSIELGYVSKGSTTQIQNAVGEGSRTSELEFYVKDTGIGIPKERHGAIFDRFIQADIANTMAHQGAGLGLAISKAYVEMLGGKIWVESEEGAGSTFFFNLPCNALPVKETIEMEHEPSGKNGTDRKLKILIAEDDEVSEILLVETVKIFGKEILKARTGVEVIELCRNNPDIDLILMDIRMPQMDGYEATRKIRELNKEVIIIAQTAYGLTGDREKSLEAGCNDYLAKPIDKNELLALIQKYFGKNEFELTDC